ncbi:hypothetical protein ABPG75_005138 [Micractinium tetrahymenae]
MPNVVGDQAMKEFVQYWGSGRTLAQLLKEARVAPIIEQTVLYHVINKPLNTSAWPSAGKRKEFTKAGGSLKLYRDADGDPQVQGFNRDAKINRRNINMVVLPNIAPYNFPNED